MHRAVMVAAGSHGLPLQLHPRASTQVPWPGPSPLASVSTPEAPALFKQEQPCLPGGECCYFQMFSSWYIRALNSAEWTHRLSPEPQCLRLIGDHGDTNLIPCLRTEGGEAQEALPQQMQHMLKPITPP